MKINFLGDSITEGACASKVEENYVSRVGQIMGCEVRNYGIGGTRIARQKDLTKDYYGADFVERADNMNTDADFVFVFGGTNDYGHGDAEMGTLDSKDVYTFYGALNVLIEKLVNVYGKENLCFILPLHRYDEENPYGEGRKPVKGEPLSGYVSALRTTVEKWGIDYLDFEEEFPVPDTNTPSDILADGLHPNSKGHAILADKICAYLKNKQ